MSNNRFELSSPIACMAITGVLDKPDLDKVIEEAKKPRLKDVLTGSAAVLSIVVGGVALYKATRNPEQK
jgi:hypothetical protein